MTDNMGRGILAPRSGSQIQDGAREMRTIARTTAAAISDLDRQVSSKVGNLENLAGVNTNDIAVWRQATAEIQNKIDEIEQDLEPGEDGKDGDPGPPGPGGSIALEETDPGCFVDSEITWMQWPESGGLPSVWNPNTQQHEQPIRVDTSVGTRVFVGDTMIYGDTGWRDVTGAIPREVLGGTMLIRRTTSAAFIYFYDLLLADSEFSYQDFGGRFLPTGFYDPDIQWFYVGGLASRGANYSTGAVRVSMYGGLRVFDVGPGQYMTGLVNLSTSQNWPSTLPGTPA